MSDRRWPEFADQFDEHAMPCHNCGTLVRVASSSVEDTVQSWADETVRIWCADCWPHGNEANV